MVASVGARLYGDGGAIWFMCAWCSWHWAAAMAFDLGRAAVGRHSATEQPRRDRKTAQRGVLGRLPPEAA
jgi:hypothetical protein